MTPESAAIALPPEELARAFPFHLAFDERIQVVQAGPSLRRVLRDLAPGQPVHQWFDIDHIDVEWTGASLKSHLRLPLVLKCKSRQLTLRGELLWLEAPAVFVFLCTAWMPDVASLRSIGLSLKHFPFHDASADLPQVVQAQAMAFADVKKLADKLASQRGELREAREALQKEVLELQRSQALNASILQTAPSGIVTIDEHGIIESVNPAAEQIFGYRADELIGREVGILAPSPYRENHPSFVARYLRTGVPRIIGFGRDVEGQRKDGTLVPIHLAVGEARVGDTVRFTGIVRDLTAIKEAERLLRASEERFALAVEGANDGIWDWDIVAQRYYYSPRYAELLGYAAEETSTVFANFAALMHPDDRASSLAALDRHLAEGVPFEIEFRLRHKDGSWRWISSRGRAVRDPDGRPVRMAGSATDITERREAEEALRLAREKEVETSAAIQSSLLAGRVPRALQGLHASALSIPSQRVDGDFIDFLASGPILQLTVGDVMGKGIRAALLGAATKNQFLRATIAGLLGTRTGVPSSSDVVNAVHQVLTPGCIQLETFVTVCVSRFDTAKRCVTYVNAGHTKILRRTADTGSVEYLTGRNLPLGVLPDEVYSESRVELLPGDIFVFYSDGVTEATSPEGEMFSQERLADAVRAFGGCSCKQLVRAIHRRLVSFTGGSRFGDDLSIVAIRVDDVEPPLRTEQWQAAPELSSAADIRERLRLFLSEHAKDRLIPGQQDDLALALHETFTNCIRHGRATAVSIALAHYSNRFTARVTASSPPYDPDAVIAPFLDGSQDSGFGLHIIDEVVDAARHYREDHSNIVELIQFYAPPDTKGSP